MTNREVLREQIARIIHSQSITEYPCYPCRECEKAQREADAILSLPNLEVRAENQELPKGSLIPKYRREHLAIWPMARNWIETR